MRSEPLGEWAAPGEVAPPPLPPPPAPAAPVARLSYSALEGYARCPYRFYLERVLGLPPELPTTAEPGAGLPANVRGTLAHALLERAPDTPPTADEVAELAAAHGAELTAADVEDLRALVGAFLNSSLSARVAAARDVRREAGFTFALTGPDGMLLTGAVDLIATEADSTALVIDYKTDRLGEADPTEVVERAYRAQRLIYALAALREGARAVEVVHCFLERADEPVAARYEAADAPALEAELADLAAGVFAGRFPPTDTPHRDLCAACPGRAALCSWPEDVTSRPLEEAIA